VNQVVFISESSFISESAVSRFEDRFSFVKTLFQKMQKNFDHDAKIQVLKFQP